MASQKELELVNIQTLYWSTVAAHYSADISKSGRQRMLAACNVLEAIQEFEDILLNGAPAPGEKEE